MIILPGNIKLIPLLPFAFLPFMVQSQTDTSASKNWVAKSNAYTKILIDIDQKYSPEFGSSQGLAFYDTLISIPTLANDLAQRKETESAVATFKAAKLKETDAAIKQDLDILINQAELGFRNEDFTLNKKVSFLNAAGDVFSGLQILLDDQTPAERRNAAVMRLQK